MRSKPSSADEQLIAQLAAEDLHVSAAQLERWRHCGLLPRATRLKGRFGGSAIALADEDTIETVRALSRLSGRGRPWQLTAIDLYYYGFDLSTAAFRAAARYTLEASLRPFRRKWAEVEAAREATTATSDEVLEDIASETARLVSRSARRLIEEEVRLAHRFTPACGWPVALDQAVTWRIVDIVAPTRLTTEQRNRARHGVDEPWDPFWLVNALPSERAACVETLTWGEGQLAREWMRVTDPELLSVTDPVTVASWWITAQRLVEDPLHPERPMPEERLDRVSRELVELLAQVQADSTQEPLESST